jgi:hypothetical protein
MGFTMSSVVVLIGILGTIIGVLGASIGLLPYFKNRGVNVAEALSKIEAVINEADNILDVTKPLLPKDVVNILDVIEKWSKIAVGSAEQLYHAGDIEKAERTKIAENVVLNVLNEMNITIDDNKRALIDASIKNAVNDLGHEPTTEVQKNR